LAEVTAGGKVFKSPRMKLKKVEAEQEAARLAFEHFQLQQQNHDTSTASKN